MGPQKKVYVPHFLGKEAKKGTRINFFGGILGSKRGPKRAIFGHTKFSLLFFPALINFWSPRKSGPRSYYFWELKCPKTGILEILVEFLGGGVQNGIFCSVRGPGECKTRLSSAEA